jgi:diacylglycerol kinase (ATP)
MRRAVLLFNPTSGRHPHKRMSTINELASALRSSDLNVEVLHTDAPGTAGRQASEACDKGADILFACGGDGTIHEVLQGFAFQPHTALGIIPLGSANALARHLRLPLDPIQAALAQLNRTPQTIPIGKVTYQTSHGEQSRYFIVMAGAGPDGALVYKMLSTGKHSLGRAMYYLRAASLFCHTRFAPFPVTYSDTTRLAVSAMAVRVGDLGGLFSPLIRGASIEQPHLTLALAHPPGWLSLPTWFAASWTRTHRWNRFVSTLEVDSFHCGLGTQPVQVQADGEWLGHTPMTVKLIPNALNLLHPTFSFTSAIPVRSTPLG